jgi:hypothetical protein
MNTHKIGLYRAFQAKTTLIFVCLLLIQHVSAQKHVFYLHGRIIETQGAKAVDKENGYGEYRYQDILDSLKRKGLIVHSEVRPANTVVADYAEKISSEIRSLLKSGIAASEITVIGASKGAAIAIQCSANLKNKDMRFVFLAGCCGAKQINCSGKILSIFEASDACGSCKELELKTGLRHGFFYRPRPEWLNPTLEWIFQK